MIDVLCMFCIFGSFWTGLRIFMKALIMAQGESCIAINGVEMAVFSVCSSGFISCMWIFS